MSTTEMPLERAVLKEAARSLLSVAIELNNTSDIQLQARVLGALAALAPASLWVGELRSAVDEVLEEARCDG
jgi:hypothetical protein